MIVEYDVDFDAKRNKLAKELMREKPNLGIELAQYLARQELLKRMRDKAYFGKDK